jgi:hypothetical protein
MMGNAKKFAMEVADLKTKLAEKSSQLSGGFGAPSVLALGEMPAPILDGGAQRPPSRGTLAPLSGGRRPGGGGAGVGFTASS